MSSLFHLVFILSICILSAATVQAEKIALGPASIYVDMSLVPEPFVDVREPYSDIHATNVGPIKCTVYHAVIGGEDLIIQLHHLAGPIEITPLVLRQFIADSLLIPASWSFSDARSTFIGGRVQGYEGIMVDASCPDGFPMRVTAFCPKTDRGTGEMICLVRSSICPRCDRAILDSMRVNA